MSRARRKFAEGGGVRAFGSINNWAPMDSVAKILESYPWLADALKYLLVAVGSGAIWEFLRHRLLRREHAVQSAMAISQLRKELLDQLVQLIERSEQYANIRDGIVKVPIPGNELRRLQVQIDLLKDDISAGELRLAKLEGREPRPIPLSYIRPSPPTGLKIVGIGMSTAEVHTPRAYLDTDVLSASVKPDMAEIENKAIDQLVQLSRKGRLVLVASELNKREIQGVPEEHRGALEQAQAALPLVEFIEDHKILGFNTLADYRGGFMAYPLVEDERVTRKLREIGLDRTDAHHVMLAIRAGCEVFLTCDEKTILRHRVEVEREFPIRLMKPSEFASELSAGTL